MTHPMRTGARLELKDVTKTYTGHGEDKHVLDHINCIVEPGEFFYIVGYSGVGKTTPLRLLTGLTPVTSGEILLDGKRVTSPLMILQLLCRSTPVL